MLLPSELHELLPKDKLDLERATALVSIGYPAVAPILPELLEWLRDGNWPVSHVIGPFLASIGAPLTEEVRRILQTQDHLWKYWILGRVVSHSPELTTACSFGGPACVREKSVNGPMNPPNQSRAVVMVGRSICHSR